MPTKQLCLLIVFLAAAHVQSIFAMKNQPEEPLELGKGIPILKGIPHNSSIMLTKNDNIALLSPYCFQLINPSTQQRILDLRNSFTYEPTEEDLLCENLTNHEFYSMALNDEKTEIAVKNRDYIRIYSETGTIKFEKQFPGIAAIAFHLNNSYLVTHTLKQTATDAPSSIQIHYRYYGQQPFITTLKTKFDDSRPDKISKYKPPLRPIMTPNPSKNELALRLSRKCTLYEPSLIFYDKICLINELLLPKETKQHILTKMFFAHINQEIYIVQTFKSYGRGEQSYNFIDYTSNGSKIATIWSHKIQINDTEKQERLPLWLFSKHRVIESALFHRNNKIIIAIDSYGYVVYSCVESGESISSSFYKKISKPTIHTSERDQILSDYRLPQKQLDINDDGTKLFATIDDEVVCFNIPQKVINYEPTKPAPPSHPLATFWQNNSTLIKTTLGLGGIIAAWLWYYRSHR